ncbi:MAG: cytochrome c oxidase subunit II, partial [Solirubrobacteraceae bacterium]
IAGAVLRYRRRPADQAARWHENNPVEGTYTVLLACIVAFLLYLTFTAEHRVDTVANQERPSLVVDVTAAKWEWAFRYPQYGITHLSGTVHRQPLVVPANEAIRFNLTSLDVIHAFWIPQLEYKHQLIPGMTQHETLTFTQQGLFQGQCAVFCGLLHSEMVFNVRVLSPSAFAVWARSKGRSGY